MKHGFNSLIHILIDNREIRFLKMIKHLKTQIAKEYRQVNGGHIFFLKRGN